MTVMRRGETWSFVAWVRDREGARRHVWRGGYRLKRDAVAAERRFLVEAEDHASEPASRIGPTLREFLEDWLVQSASTRRPTTSVSISSASPSPRQACPRSASTTCFTPPRRWRWPLASTRRSCRSGSATRRWRSHSMSTATSSPACKKKRPPRLPHSWTGLSIDLTCCRTFRDLVTVLSRHAAPTRFSVSSIPPRRLPCTNAARTPSLRSPNFSASPDPAHISASDVVRSRHSPSVDASSSHSRARPPARRRSWRGDIGKRWPGVTGQTGSRLGARRRAPQGPPRGSTVMRVRPPTDRERATLRCALLASADELGVDGAEPLALPMFHARAGLVARELSTSTCASTVIATGSRTARSEPRSASRCSRRICASATLVRDPNCARSDRVMNRYRLAGSATRYRPKT